ncbi:hypothetical protein BZB76_1364 [Actinomadura pelletieri DSM 43383]|uniref:HTH cro/C1-type domain-containing protein n=1 Tax=Actinomadura pelletieri DSM 43383 TaxID=1120940 RepID=A0A495R067_9ACTN|nr:hypothetical protein BZB76_1364 [Actinomadura pelletieri DSM 43383]
MAGVETGGRTIAADVIAALTYWPDLLYEDDPEPADLTVLPPFFNGLLQDLPWWNRDWKVVHAGPGHPMEIESDYKLSTTRFTEVSVPGTISSGSGESLPFVAKVRFTRDQLVRFQAKIGDMVLSPAQTAAGQLEPHPFATIFARLMDVRGISPRQVARLTFRAEATIRGLSGGSRNPHTVLVREVAGALGLSEADLRAIAGLDDDSD